MRRRVLFGLILGLGAIVAQPAQAAIVNFTASLDGAQEAPTPVVTPATGSATATLNDVTGDLSLTGTFSNLIGTSNNAHIHGPAPIGTAAGVLVPLSYDAGVNSGNFSVNTTLTAGQMANLVGGLTYINIHSTSFGGGEIRGQLLVSAVPEPSSAAVLGLLIGIPAFCRRRRR